MTITTSNPLVIDGKTYSSLGVQLAVSPAWGEASLGAQVAVRLVPFRLDESGKIDRREDHARTYVEADAFVAAATDPALAAAVLKILSAIQDVVTLRGL